MTCPYCMTGMFQQWMSGWAPDPAGLRAANIGEFSGMAAFGLAGVANSQPKTKLQLAQEYASEVRKRKPEMIVRRSQT